MMTEQTIQTNTNFIDDIFACRVPRSRRWLATAWIVGLFLGGCLFWVWFLQAGNIKFSYQDWTWVTAPRLQLVKDALMHGQLPFHIQSQVDLKGGTDRYMAIPDAFLAPQAVLLLFLDIGKFVLANQVLMFAVGFAGLLWFRRRFSLSLFAFTILVVLFSFNGHILSHLSAGHVTWGGYFLFPWFAALLVRLIDGDRSWAWVAKMALLLFGTFLLGSFHQFVWALLFLAVLALTSWKHAIPIGKAWIFAIVISLVRILPPALMAGKYSDITVFFGGYPTAATVLDGLFGLHTPADTLPVQFTPYVMGWWEVCLYVGVVGTFFLAFFGGVRWLLMRNRQAGYPELAIPILVLTLLSLGQAYEAVRVLHIPLFNGELVTSRIISLPFVFLTIFAVIELQRWLDEQPLTRIGQGIAGALLVIGLHDFWAFSRTWRLDTAMTFFNQELPPLESFTVANHPDAPYFQLLGWGTAGTLAGLSIVGLFAWLERRGTLERWARPLAIGLSSHPDRKAPTPLSSRARRWLVELIAPGSLVSRKAGK